MMPKGARLPRGSGSRNGRIRRDGNFYIDLEVISGDSRHHKGLIEGLPVYIKALLYRRIAGEALIGLHCAERCQVPGRAMTKVAARASI